jgi:NTP pyrophosphatase (non-canonical NTP hydrolase)
MLTVEVIQAQIRTFRDEREWMQFHDPKNMATAISVEAAELLEHFLWVDSTKSEALAKERLPQIADEMADIGIYLLELADNLGINILVEIENKLNRNQNRYPVAKAKGSSKKCSEF